MKKVLIFVIIITLSSFSFAYSLPKYDFTFYKTSDETLSSMTKEKIGIDITGYGFLGGNSNRGIYIRLGIQTPLETLLTLKDNLFKEEEKKEENGESEISNSDGNYSNTLNDDDITQDSTLIEDKTSLSEATSTPPVLSSSLDSPLEDSEEISDTPNKIDTPQVELKQENQIEAKEKKDSDITKTEWKLLLTLGPAYRKMMGDNALIYCGIGVSLQMQYLKEFSSLSGNFSSLKFAILGADLDTGFRIGLGNSHTSIRIGVHFLSEIFGFKRTTIYDSKKNKMQSSWDLYGYVMGKKGLLGALYTRGYIRLATTFMEKEYASYNYSNRTSIVGNGEISYIIN